MVENSPADLVMLAGEVAVTVTREEQHQAVLANYGPDRHVVVELTWCAITTGKYRGQRAIEVRMDGHRVGELTYLMSQRYAPLVAQVNARGGRAGCAALIERDARGLQLTLRLPSETDPPTVRVPAVTTTFAAPPAPMPVGASSGNTFTRHPRAWGIGVVVFAVLLIAGIVGGGDKQQSASPTAGDETTTVDLPTTTAVPPTSTTTTTTPPPPPPTTTTQVAPPPAPVTEQPAPAQPQCDPNYSGCVPIASDVDCAGGSGNGPAYAEGPVRVIGSDIYDLDKDHDGTACE